MVLEEFSDDFLEFIPGRWAELQVLVQAYEHELGKEKVNRIKSEVARLQSHSYPRSTSYQMKKTVVGVPTSDTSSIPNGDHVPIKLGSNLEMPARVSSAFEALTTEPQFKVSCEQQEDDKIDIETSCAAEARSDKKPGPKSAVSNGTGSSYGSTSTFQNQEPPPTYPSIQVPVQVNLPRMSSDPPGTPPRYVTIHVPASCIYNNQLHDILSRAAIQSTMSLPPELAAARLQSQVNLAIQEDIKQG